MGTTWSIPRRAQSTGAGWLPVLVLLVACGGDSGPSGPDDADPAPIPARLEVEVPDSLTEGEEFGLAVAARTEAGQLATDFSGTVTLSLSAGMINPASISLAGGTASVTVTITAATGPVTLTARSGGLEGSAVLAVLPPLDRLVGNPDDPAATAIPPIPYRVDEDDFTTGHPDLPDLPLAVDLVVLNLRLGTTVGDANQLLQELQAEIVGGIPGVAEEVPGILMLRVPTASHAEMETLLNALRNNAIVETVVQDVLLGPDLVTRSNGGQPAEWEWASLAFGGNWGLKRSRVPQLWNLNPGVRKAIASGASRASGTLVLDAEFAPTHPDVAYSNLRPSRVGAHGTNVAGIIGATHDNELGIDGLNPFAVLTVFATESLGTLISDYLAQTTANPTIRVVNTSLGYNWYLQTPPVNPDNDPAAQAMASRNGTLFSLSQRIVATRRPLPVLVTTAGNSGGSNARFNSPQANAALEHGHANIIVVEALAMGSSPDGAVRAGYSGVNGHLSAPGSGILSTADPAQLDGYSTGDGTSLAAPHVAGLAGYLYTLEPTLADPTTTSNPLRDVLVRSAIPVPGGAPPRIDAYAAAHQVGGLRTVRMVTDIDDGTPDGNTRIDPETGAPVLTYDVDGDGEQGDGVVDMSDFRRWRDAYLFLSDPPGLRLDGADDHPKKDLNGSGDIDFLGEFFFPFVDLNGDNDVDPTTTAYLPGAIDAEVTDLQVLQHLFDDPHYDAADLDGLLESADIAIHPVAIQGTNPTQISSSVTAPGDNTSWAERVHSGIEADGEGLYQVYTVPVGSPGEVWDVRAVALDAAGDTLVNIEKSFAVHPGEDHYWDPEATCGAPPAPARFIGREITEQWDSSEPAPTISASIDRESYGDIAVQSSMTTTTANQSASVIAGVGWEDHWQFIPVDGSRVGEAVTLRVRESGRIFRQADPDETSFSWAYAFAEYCIGGQCSPDDEAPGEDHAFDEIVEVPGWTLGSWDGVSSYVAASTIIGPNNPSASAATSAELQVEIVEVIDASGLTVPIAQICTASGARYGS